MDELIFATGEHVQCDMFLQNQTDEFLFARVDGVTYIEAATLFSNEESVSHLEWGLFAVDGYTHLDALITEGTKIRARLSRPR